MKKIVIKRINAMPRIKAAFRKFVANPKAEIKALYKTGTTKLNHFYRQVRLKWNALPRNSRVAFALAAGVFVLVFIVFPILVNVVTDIEFRNRPIIEYMSLLDGQQDVKLNEPLKIKLTKDYDSAKLTDIVSEQVKAKVSVKKLNNSEYEILPDDGWQADSSYTVSIGLSEKMQNTFSISFSTVKSPKVNATNLANVYANNSPIILSFTQPIFSNEYNKIEAEKSTQINDSLKFEPVIEYTTEYLSPSIVRLTPKGSRFKNGHYKLSISASGIVSEDGVKMKEDYAVEFNAENPEKVAAQIADETSVVYKKLTDVKSNTKNPVYVFLNKNVNTKNIDSEVKLTKIGDSTVIVPVSIEVSKMTLKEYESRYSGLNFAGDIDQFILVKLTPKENWLKGVAYELTVTDKLALTSGAHMDSDMVTSIAPLDAFGLDALTPYGTSIVVEFTTNIVTADEKVKSLVKLTDSKGLTVKFTDLYVSGRTVVVYASFVAGNEYKLTINPGLSDQFGSVTKDKIEKKFTVPAATEPQYISMEGPTFAMVENTGSHKLLIETGGVKQVKTEVVKVTQIKQLLDIPKSDKASEFSYIFGLSNVVMTKSNDFTDTKKKQFSVDFNNQEDGLYIIRVSSGEARTYKVISLTKQITVLKSSEKKSIAWVLSAKDGTAYSGKELKALSSSDSEIFKATTNKDGIAVFDENVDYVFNENFDVFSSGEFSGEMNSYDSDWGTANDTVAYIFTDRTIYRPGDTINYKAFIRSKASEILAPAKVIIPLSCLAIMLRKQLQHTIQTNLALYQARSHWRKMQSWRVFCTFRW